MSKVLIVYHTFTGKTKKMAETLAEGVQSVQVTEVKIVKAAEAQPDDFAGADAVAFGAPNTFGGMAGALRDFFDRAWPVHEKTAGKPAVAFTSENPGETGALQEIKKFFPFYGLKSVGEGISTHGDLGENELKQCRELGRLLGQASKKR
ncbi:MAG: flavodoxin [Spirochaetes bacterium]|nr:MAG: flavodoxin [Spirochaetota bacterium]